MAKRNNTKKAKSIKSKSVSKGVNVGGNVEKSIVIDGDNNVVNYYDSVLVDAEKHEPDSWNLKHPYPLPPNFTGRVAERTMLTQWLNEDNENRLFILRALGGFGKSALTWYWLKNDVKSEKWPKVVFWSFYESGASFENFVKETLEYLKVDVPQGVRLQVDALLKVIQYQKILLILDGFERALRIYANIYAAYQEDEHLNIKGNQLNCIDRSAEAFLIGVCALPNIKAKILMTTQLTPQVIKSNGEGLEGCREVEINGLRKEDAIEFFTKQKIQGTRSEIDAACILFGYHPFSLRILLGLIADDRETPGDIKAARKLKVSEDIIQNQKQILNFAYNGLEVEQQSLLSKISCFRSSINYAEIKIVAGLPARKRKNTKIDLIELLKSNLKSLETRGLLYWDRESNKYSLHPIVRRYAYDRLSTDERIAIHMRLRDHFVSMDSPEKPESLNDLANAIEFYYHSVRAKQFNEAAAFFYNRLSRTTFYKFGAYQLHNELISGLFPDGEDNLPPLSREDAQSWVLSSLAGSYAMSGQPYLAMPLQNMSNKIDEKIGNKKGAAIGRGNMASLKMIVGKLREANVEVLNRIKLSEEIPDVYYRYVARSDLAELQAYWGEWEKSDQELEMAKIFFDDLGVKKTNFVSVIRVIYAWSSLLRKKTAEAVLYASEALELSLHPERSEFGGERDVIYANWLLGAAYRLASIYDVGKDLPVTLIKAEQFLSEALRRCRMINLVEVEANVLLDFARLRYDLQNYEEARSLADEALTITERCEYVLQGADVNLFLAQYTLEQENDKVKAKEYAETALKLAYCDGPPYYYKVAYHEAERMLEKLK
jgi:hypothetical protein